MKSFSSLPFFYSFLFCFFDTFLLGEATPFLEVPPDLEEFASFFFKLFFFLLKGYRTCIWLRIAMDYVALINPYRWPANLIFEITEPYYSFFNKLLPPIRIGKIWGFEPGSYVAIEVLRFVTLLPTILQNMIYELVYSIYRSSLKFSASQGIQNFLDSFQDLWQKEETPGIPFPVPKRADPDFMLSTLSKSREILLENQSHFSHLFDSAEQAGTQSVHTLELFNGSILLGKFLEKPTDLTFFGWYNLLIPKALETSSFSEFLNFSDVHSLSFFSFSFFQLG